MDDKETPSTYQLKDGALIRVRPATLEDVRDLHAYFLELGVPGRHLRFGFTRTRNRGYVRKMVELDEPFIALDPNGKLIGEALFEPNPFDDQQFSDWAAVEMSVAARWRRRGVGAALLGVLVEHARAAGIRRLVIDTLRRNPPVLDWAQSHGAVKRDHPDANWRRFEKGI